MLSTVAAAAAHFSILKGYEITIPLADTQATKLVSNRDMTVVATVVVVVITIIIIITQNYH